VVRYAGLPVFRGLRTKASTVQNGQLLFGEIAEGAGFEPADAETSPA
jgi:hypothetical protein